MTATARQVDDDLVTNIAVFTGNAIIDQPTRGQMRGERIVYNIDSGQVTSGGDGTRVSMHIIPKQKTATPKPDARASPSADQAPAKTP
jgi:lipopolysaccharide export system protein LptA